MRRLLSNLVGWGLLIGSALIMIGLAVLVVPHLWTGVAWLFSSWLVRTGVTLLVGSFVGALFLSRGEPAAVMDMDSHR